MPRAIESMDLRGYDVIVSSSHAVAKGIIPRPTAVHICYCHTPMRYAWEMEEQYFDDFRVPPRFRPLFRRMLKRIPRWDLTTAKRVDRFIANSRTTQERIQRIYARESVVIPPPVHDRFFRTPIPYPLFPTPYFLSVGRLVPYKRIDLIIAAAGKAGFSLKIAGEGQDRRRLQAMAGPTVEFLGPVPDDALPALYAGATALLFPTLEDAGLTPMEAQACGTPVIAYGKGGVCETVEDGVTGMFFQEQALESLLPVLEQFRTVSWDRSVIHAHARRFSAEKFREKVRETVSQAYESFRVSSPHGRGGI